MTANAKQRRRSKSKATKLEHSVEDSDDDFEPEVLVVYSKEELERLEREAERCHLLVYNPVKYEIVPFKSSDYVTFPPFTRHMFFLYWTIFDEIEKAAVLPELRSSRIHRLVTQPALKYTRSAPKITMMSVISPRIWEYLPKTALEYQLCHAFLELERQLFILTQVSAPSGVRVKRPAYGISNMSRYLSMYSGNLRSQDEWLLKALEEGDSREKFENEYISLQQRRCSQWESGLKQAYGTPTLEEFQQFMVDRILDACNIVRRMINREKAGPGEMFELSRTVNGALSARGTLPSGIISPPPPSKVPATELDANERIRLTIIFMHFNELWYDHNLLKWSEYSISEVCRQPYTAGITFAGFVDMQEQ